MKVRSGTTLGVAGSASCWGAAMDVDLGLVVAGALVGFVVGLTGMGGGALMTPILVLLFNVPPLTAVSSDLVASLAMKPVGGAVHARRGTVHTSLVKWLVIGSVPAAFLGVFALRWLGDGRDLEGMVKLLLGGALVLASTTMIVKQYLTMRDRARAAALGVPSVDDGPLHIRPGPTVALGVVGGLVVGMTSVGSGSLIIIGLILMYPMLKPNAMVGTDLVQAIPLVASAALAHVLFGDFSLALTTSLLVGALPAVYLGARVSSAAPAGIIRRVLVFVLLASGMKLLGVPNEVLGVALLVAAPLAPLGWMWLRASHGLPARGPRRTRLPTTVRAAGG